MSMMTKTTTAILRAGLPPLPDHMKALRVDDRGYPVPWFVAWIDGIPDFRVADSAKAEKARRFSQCWICGNRLGVWKSFVIGPMCAVNRVTSEPPCHWDCAEFSALACPFLTLPKAQRRDTNMPADVVDPAGMMIPRNPGVTCLWTTNTYRVMRVDNGALYRLGDPMHVRFFTQKRPATRTEILESIDSGMPTLEREASKEGPDALAALADAYRAMLPLLPAAA